MPAELDLFLKSQPLYDNLLDCFNDEAPGLRNPDFGVGLHFYLVKDISVVQAERLLAEHQKIYNGEHRLAFLDTEYEVLRSFSQAGWQTVLYNPEGALAPSPLPLQDADIRSFDALAALPSLLSTPSLGQCFAWWDAWHLPENVRQHSIKVAWAAYVLAVLMRNKGIALDPMLAHRAGLLHDIDKIKTLKLGYAHGKQGAEYIEEKGYPGLAVIVRDHIMDSVLKADPNERGWEDRLVFFSDKLVEGDRIISFEQRLVALKERYPDYRDTMTRAEGHIWRMNDQICSVLSISNHEKLISTLVKLQYN